MNPLIPKPVYTEKQREEIDRWTSKNLDGNRSLFTYSFTEIHKIILWASGGIFAVSITFLGQLSNISWAWLLIASWISLVGSIIALTYDHFLTQWIADKKMELINIYRKDGYPTFPDDFQMEYDKNPQVKKWQNRGRYAIGAVLAFLFLGIGLLIVFVSHNLLNRIDHTKVEEKRNIQEVQIELLNSKMDTILNSYRGKGF